MGSLQLWFYGILQLLCELFTKLFLQGICFKYLERASGTDQLTVGA